MLEQVKSKVLVSLIIPVYNTQEFLSNLFECVRAQTFRDFEVIFVDDGSPDDSAKILDEFKKECEMSAVEFSVVVLHNENGGLSNARNSGIDASRGDFIVFADSDDSFSPSYLEALLKAIDYGENDIGCIDYRYVHKVTEPKDIKLNPSSYYVIDKLDGFGDFAEFVCRYSCVSNFPSASFAWNKIYKKSLIGELRYIPFLPAEDVKFNVEYFDNCKKAGFLGQAHYYYLQRENSLSKQADRYNKHLRNVVKEYHSIIESLPKGSHNRSKIANYFFCCLILFYLVCRHLGYHKKDRSIKGVFRNFFKRNYKYLLDRKNRFRIWYWWGFRFLYICYRIFGLL